MPKLMTLQTIITEYDGDTMRMHLSAGYHPQRGCNCYEFGR
jgi:hypothetical protein